MSDGKYIPALRFDRLTPFYDPVVQITTREKVFKKALVKQAEVKAGQSVLDLACGTGTLTILLKQAAPEANISGIDGDSKILEFAKNKAVRAGLDINFDKGFSQRMPYSDESFDHVVSSLFFHHLIRENKLKTFREVWRVLKPQGEFHIADWGHPENHLMKIGSFFIKVLDGFETTSDNFRGHLPELVKKAGFEQIEETESFNTFFGTIRLYKSLKNKPEYQSKLL